MSELWTILAVIAALYGSIEVARKQPNTLRVNLSYVFANIILFCVFFTVANWVMVIQYAGFLSISLVGVIQNGKTRSSLSRL